MTSGGHWNGGPRWLFWKLGACGLKDALMREKEEREGGEGPFPGACSPVPLCCPLGPGTALPLPSCALGSSPLLTPRLGSWVRWWQQCSRKTSSFRDPPPPSSLHVGSPSCPAVVEWGQSLQPSHREEREVYPEVVSVPGTAGGLPAARYHLLSQPHLLVLWSHTLLEFALEVGGRLLWRQRQGLPKICCSRTAGAQPFCVCRSGSGQLLVLAVVIASISPEDMSNASDTTPCCH